MLINTIPMLIVAVNNIDILKFNFFTLKYNLGMVTTLNNKVGHLKRIRSEK
jgi:hypothetical protein